MRARVIRTACLAPVLFLALLLTAPAGAQQTAGGQGYYQQPDIHGEIIVFAAEGDLWRVSVRGGLATRLTTHPAQETDPVISPDGRLLAFTARYEGPAEVYTMPLAGGEPTRRTFEGETSTATTWTPDGKLAYTTSHYSTLPQLQMVTLDLGTDVRSVVPLYTATEGDWDDRGRQLFFVRPAFHNNVTKRYTGGTARDVWRWDGGNNEAVELTGDYRGESHHPMWSGGRVYFVTDRDGTMNIWSMRPDGSDVRQHTRHTAFDIRDPSLDSGRIVYNVGADLWMYDIAADTATMVAITLASDFDQLREKWETNPSQYLSSAHLHPSGKSVVLTARGRVFVAPVGPGRLVQASRKDGVRYRDVVFMPDGQRVLGLSDETGELEFVTLPANGVGDGTTITSNGEILRFQGVPSPDGSRVAYTDNNNDLWVLTVANGRQQRVSENREGSGDMTWSADGRWLAFTEAALNSFSLVKIWDSRSGNSMAVTSDRVNSSSPAWDPAGKYLYFLSDRNLRTSVGSPWGNRGPEPYFEEAIEIYVMALQAGGDTPFRPPTELTAAEKPAEKPASGEAAAEQPTIPGIDLDGLAGRIWKVPVPSGNYRNLSATKDALYYTASGEGGGLMALKITNIDPEPVTVLENVGTYELSMDAKKMMVRRGRDLFVIDARPAKAGDITKGRVDLSGWSFPIDVREDWRQIYTDAWRLERDYFYDPNMHGVDWEGVRDRYMPLVDRVTTREELSDVIGQVVGELSVLHTSVRGGDLRDGPEDVGIGALGARIFRDERAGGFRIDYIYQNDPDFPDERSPLADPALGISAGDIITAVNGQPALQASQIGELLRNQAGKQVLLSLKSGRGNRTWESVVVPLGSESGLRYSDWEYTRRQRVEQQSDGRIGYIHLRAMGSGDINTWYRDFYPVFDRQGLIIDVRRNNGGNIDSIILEKLMRQAWMYWKVRAGQNTWNMQSAFRGHMVVLVDQNTASDGEAFAEGFKRLGLGPVIGMRTWGGEVWLSSVNTLSDNGLARAPMMGVYGPDGQWLIEQIGVIPDMEVDNLPHATFTGADAQLDAAIRYLEEQIRLDPRPVPDAPPYPDKSFRYPPPQSPPPEG